MENQKEQGTKTTNAFLVFVKVIAILFGVVVLAFIAFFVSCLALA